MSTQETVEPAFTPRVGMVIGKPGSTTCRLVCVDGSDEPWLGDAPELDPYRYWFSNADARTLVEDHGWEVMGDLTPPGEGGDAERDEARQQVADLRRSFSRAVERTAKRIERMGRTVRTELAAGLVREMVQSVALEAAREAHDD